MSTIVSVNTQSHSVTFLSDNILKSIKQLILLVGLDPSHFISDWNLLDRGIKTWITSGHLESATIEIYSKINNQLIFRWDFEINYSYGSGDDGEFWVDLNPIKNAIYKAGISAGSCQYDILLRNKPGKPDVVGFIPCDYRSTEGFVRQSVGTTIGTNYHGSQSNYWRKL